MGYSQEKQMTEKYLKNRIGKEGIFMVALRKYNREPDREVVDTLRAFRDDYVCRDRSRYEMLQTYFDLSPGIQKGIEQCSDPDSEYMEIAVGVIVYVGFLLSRSKGVEDYVLKRFIADFKELEGRFL